MTTVAITHASIDHHRYFDADDLARLRNAASVVVLDDLAPAQRSAALANTEIIISSWGMPTLDEAFLAAAPRLRAVCYAAGSVKYFVTDASYARPILITTAMHANAVPVAEISAALITLANKQWFQTVAHLRQTKRYEQAFVHPGNYRTTIGLIGFGAIGQLVAERLHGMDLDVQVYDPYAQANVLARHGVRRAADLLDLARTSAVVSLHAPNIPQTYKMLGVEFFRSMADGACFINTARGQLVDEDALIRELQTGRISAHLDVTDPEPPPPDSPLWTLPNCWLSPHLAGSSSNEIRRMGRLAIDECLRVLAGETPRYPVAKHQLDTMA